MLSKSEQSQPLSLTTLSLTIPPSTLCPIGIVYALLAFSMVLGDWISRVFPQPTVDILHLFPAHANTTHRGTSCILSSFRSPARDIHPHIPPSSFWFLLKMLSEVLSMEEAGMQRQSFLQACCRVWGKQGWESISLCPMAGKTAASVSCAMLEQGHTILPWHMTARGRLDSKNSWQ